MTGSEDGSVSVYSIQTQKLVQSINIPGISGSVLGLDSHPTKTLLAVGGIRNTKSNMGQMCVDGKTNKSEKKTCRICLRGWKCKIYTCKKNKVLSYVYI